MTLTKRMTLVLFAAAFAACNGTASTGDQVGQVGDAFAVGAVYNFGTLAHPGACMDANGGGTANGTQIQEWWCNGSGAQAFALQNAGGGAYTLVNTHAGNCVDVAARGTANGTKIQLYDCNQNAGAVVLPPAGGQRLRHPRQHQQRQVPRRRRRQSRRRHRRAALRLQRHQRAAVEPGRHQRRRRRRLDGRRRLAARPGAAAARAWPCTSPTAAPSTSGSTASAARAPCSPTTRTCRPAPRATTTPRATWSAARIYAYLQAPDGARQPAGTERQGRDELLATPTASRPSTPTSPMSIGWRCRRASRPSARAATAPPSAARSPTRSILAGCPSSLLSGHECISAGMHCLNPANARRSDVPRPRRQHRRLRLERRPAPARPARRPRRSTPARARFFGNSPQYCAALNRGVLGSPGPNDAGERLLPEPAVQPVRGVGARDAAPASTPSRTTTMARRTRAATTPAAARRGSTSPSVQGGKGLRHGAAAPVGTARRSSLRGRTSRATPCSPSALRAPGCARHVAHSNSSLASPLRGERSSTPPSRPLRLAYILDPEDLFSRS